MTKARKLVILLLVPLILLVGLAPYLLGLIIQRFYHELVTIIDDNMQGYVRVSGKIENGYWQSIAQSQITLGYTNRTFTVEHIIHHGPINWRKPKLPDFNSLAIATIETKFIGEFADDVNMLYQATDSYSIQHTVGLDGKIKHLISAKEFMQRFDRKSSLHFLGGELKVTQDLHHKQASFEVTAAGIEYLAAPATFGLENINFQVNFSYQSPVQFNLEFAPDKIYISEGADDDLFKFKMPMLSLKTNKVGELVSLQLLANVTDLQHDAEVIGPLALRLDAEKFPYEASRRFYLKTPIQELHPLLDVPQYNHAVDKEGAMAQYRLMIAQNPTAAVHFEGKTTNGNLTFDSNFEFVDNQQDYFELDEILSLLIINANMVVTKEVMYQLLADYALEKQHQKLRATTQQFTTKDLQTKITNWTVDTISYLLAKKYIVEDQHNFLVNLNLNQGQVTVNNVPKAELQIQELLQKLSTFPK